MWQRQQIEPLGGGHSTVHSVMVSAYFHDSCAMNVKVKEVLSSLSFLQPVHVAQQPLAGGGSPGAEHTAFRPAACPFLFMHCSLEMRGCNNHQSLNVAFVMYFLFLFASWLAFCNSQFKTYPLPERIFL